MNAGRRSVPTLPVPILRDAVARETAGLSLRKAASEITVSPNGLRNFLKGSVPHPATRGKLERWLAARRGGRHGALEEVPHPPPRQPAAALPPGRAAPPRPDGTPPPAGPPEAPPPGTPRRPQE